MKLDDFTTEVLSTLMGILKRGNSAEVKREKDNIVVVEIHRQAKIKSPISR